MSQILSYNSHDLNNQTAIPVIASFNNKGQLMPLYIGINGKQYKVHSYTIRRNFANQIEFQCKVIVDDMLKLLIITYYIKECLWTIPNLYD